MPRRTNPFQSLFLRLQKAVASCGANVEESAEVFNHVSERKEEIDVLVTFTNSGYSYRVGIQCRNHSRNAGADWIRDLKLQKDHCHLDKMIAVHSKGFSPAARKTATHEGIEVRTLKDAESSDWTRLHPQTFQLQIPLHLVATELSPVISASKDGLDPMSHGCLVCKCHKRRSESPNQLAQRIYREQILGNPHAMQQLEREAVLRGGLLSVTVRWPLGGHLLCFDGRHQDLHELILHLRLAKGVAPVKWNGYEIRDLCKNDGDTGPMKVNELVADLPAARVRVLFPDGPKSKTISVNFENTPISPVTSKTISFPTLPWKSRS